MSLNRHSSSRRKFNQSKKRRRKSSEASVNYESLEERRLLAVDVGLNLNTEQFGAPPNLAGAVGPNHVVTVTNQSFKVLDKVTGDILVNKPVTDFWRDRGADVMPGVSVSDEVLADGDSATNTRVVYDADTRRWFITSVGNRDIYSGIDGNQHAVLLGMSRTSNPTLDWYSVSYGYDVDADPTTGDQFYDGGFPAIGGASSGVNLAVDDNSVIVSVNSPSPFAPPEVWTFNKFEQLVRPGVPGIGSDSFGVSASVVAAAGNNHQWGTDVTGTVAGTFGLVAPAEGDTLVLTELTDTDTAGGAVAQANVAIAVDPYEAPPEFIRQEFDPDIVNGGTELSASIQRLGNSLWATHAILGSGNGSNPDGGVTETSAIRWYEIDLDTKTVKQSGTIDHPQYNYIYPSIAVTEAGHVAISYTAAGVGENAGDGLFPSLAVSVGYNNGGNIIMEESRILKDGEGGYFDGRGNRWGNYASTVADPNDPTKAWVFGYWADDSVRSNGQIQAVEISLIGHSPEIVGDANPNVMVVRRSALDNAMIEVEIDGTVVNTYTETMLHSITLNGMGGDDTFIVDTVNGELEFLGGVEVIGDGDDTFVASTLENTTWELGLDGGGQAAIGNDFPPPCDEPHPDEQVVNLNFEADSLWFDDTAYNQNGYATFGDALRGELQLYFDNTIIPLFEGSFTVTLDITDNEVDSLATSEAFGYGFHDLNGENVWAASPWSIMTGRGDSNGVDESDGMINYNLDLSRFGGDQQALLDNITGGLTRSQYFRVLGMESFIPNETQNFDPRGNRDVASVMDLQYFDINDAAVVGNYDANDSTFEVLNYTTNANWAGDGSGLYFMGVSDTGTPMPLSVNSNTELIDFETIASSLAGTSRDGSFNDIVEQDRAFLRGLGFSLSPVTPPELSPGFDVVFTGIDEVQAGDGTDYFCIGSSNIDIMVSSGLGNDTFNVTGLGVGALNLFGEGGDDTYEVVFSSSGVITIIDSVGTENDTLIGKGTSIADEFIFDVNGVKVNSGLLIYVGIENATFDGLGDDDVFEVKAEQYGIIGLTGGEGVDTFIDSSGLDQQLAISVDDPVADPVDRLSLDLTGSFVDAYTADEVERFVVDGTFVIDGVNGTPTVAGGLNLIGDGDETLVVESALDAGWMISGDGSGDLTMDVEPLNFTGLESIVGTTGINTVDVTNTSTDLEITTREGADVFNIENVGPGIVTVNSGDADDVFNIINSGGGVFLMGEVGDDSYNVDLTNPGGLITIRDSVGSENDSLSALGTAGDDVFIFDGTLVDVNGVQIDHEGVENVSYDGLAGDDIFEIRSAVGGDVKDFTGGEGNDLFIVNDMGAGANGNQLRVSVADPSGAVNQLQLDVSSVITDTFFADTIENLSVDGLYLIDGVNGTPTVAGGLNLLGDGDERLTVESALDAAWTVDGDGAGGVTMDVDPMTFNGLESFVGTTGVNTVDVTNTSTDLEITTRDGADVINIENVGPGIVTVNSGDADDVFNIINSGGGVFLMGEVGDDDYNVDLNNPGGLITIRDSVGSENDSLSALGTAGDDVFIFDGTLVDVNGVQIDHEGVENVSYDGLAGDDIFEIRSAVGGDVKDFTGGEGDDLFIVNDMGAGANGNQLRVSVADPSGALNQLQLDVSSVITDTFFADTIENLSVEGLYLIDGVNGTPTVAGGLNLLGDGDERLTVESALDAAWTIDGDGAGGVTMDVETMTFNGLERIIGTTGVDTFDVTNTSTDLDISTRDGADVFNIENVGTGFVVGNGGEDDDEFNIIDSGGGVLLRGQAGDDEFTLSDNSSRANGTVDLEGGDGEDSFLVTSLRLNGFVRLTGGAGDDSITMDYSGNGTLDADGDGGNDEFFVEGTGSGFIDLRGEVGDDTYYVNSVDPAADFNIIDSVNAENDKLVATGTEFDDVFDIGGDTETTILNGHQWSIIGIEEYSIDGLGGNDVFNVTTTDMFTGVINLSGNDGADSFVVNESGSGIVNLNGDAGDDSYTVHFKPNTDVTITDSVGSENDRFFGFGTENADVFEIDQNAPVVNGGMVVMTGVESEEYDGLGGDDTFNVHSTIGDSRFKGGEDADTFNIDMTSDGNVFMGQAGTDVFNVATSSGDAEFYGGDGVDGFYVAETTGNGEFFGGNDADYFSINLATGVSKFFGDAGEDLFDIVNHGPMGASGAIEVDGGADRNRLEVLGYQTKTNMVVVSKDRITGMSAVPIVYSASGSFSVENGIGGIELTGSDNHSDGFNVNNLLPTHTLNMIGGGGNDRFTVSQGALGGVSADGEEGSDLYQYSMGSNNNRFLFALDSGVVGSDRLIAYLTNGDDTLSLSGEAFAVQTDNLMFNENYESLFVSARGGNDEITVNSVPVNFVRIIGGAGDDIIDVNNYEQVGSLLVNGDAGDDTIDIESGTVSGNFTAFGGTGDDSFLVSKASYGNAYIDGQEGSDNYEIQIADRSSRLVVARDSGVVGVDNLDVYGTVVGDFVTFRSGVMLTPQQSILYTDKTETMNLFTEGLDDNVTVYGLSSPVTNIMTESGKDLVHVRSSFGPATSKVLNIDTGSNDDYVLVSGVGADTTTTINTGVGNDNVTLGSSLSANVGNLNDLYGTIDISMGLGNDRIYMNDVGKVASADYEVGAGFLRSTPGGPNSFFAGITYDNTVETLRLDTTNYRNEVLVTPSSSTAFSFFGGGGLNIIELTGDADDDGRQFSGQDGGVGSWSFSNGSRDVFFSDYFIG